MTVVCIHQPDFAPHLGFFHRLLLADHFIVLDDVQFLRRGWHHRDFIKGRNGKVWLTLSVAKADYHQKINEILLADDPLWIAGNLNLLRDFYRRAPYFDELFPRIEAIYQGGHRRLVDFNIAIMQLAFEYLGVTVPISYASHYGVQAVSTARLVSLTQAASGDVYLTGTGSIDYLDESAFNAAGIDVRWQEFRHPVYHQLHGEFEPQLSCLDLLFNCGPESAAILRNVDG